MPGCLPAVCYLYWLFYRNPAFSFYSGTAYVFPATLDFAWALAPAAILALTALTQVPAAREAQRAMVHLAIWGAFGLVVILAQPVHFSLQFLVGIGFPFLALGAVGLSRLRPSLVLATAVAFSTTLVIAWRLILTPNPHWLTPRENLAIVAALEPACHAGDIVLAPPSIGIFVHGLTPCRSFVSHAIAPDYEARLEEIRRFSLGSPAERLSFLDRTHVRHLILPGDEEPSPVAWLGENAPFRRRAGVGQGPGSLSIYSTEASPAGR